MTPNPRSPLLKRLMIAFAIGLIFAAGSFDAWHADRLTSLLNTLARPLAHLLPAGNSDQDFQSPLTCGLFAVALTLLATAATRALLRPRNH